ncbi:hypothetical protein [Orlajensenia leifsoniae]|uniref:Uncharacterized protein n=1 Tax=Orlajensenia leifsoniae TaxID=2561933 RepID=A0A4Y9R6I0_9MICO|nr:hypothetical protein [Leifsonia flava]TFV99907.1 hypothetical protein E4M00_01510 [Leifsonia flava]
MGDSKSFPDVGAPVHRTGLSVRIVLVILWAALAAMGMYLLYNGAVESLSILTTADETERLASVGNMLLVGAALILAAAAIALAFKVLWWQAALVAAPALTYPLSEINWIFGYVWSMVSLIVLVLGATAVVMKAFGLGGDQLDQRPSA